MHRIILFTAGVLNVCQLAAQERPKSPARDSLVTLDETVVTVSRNATNLAATYVSVDVLPSRLALDKPTGRIEQTLQMAPGVTMQDGQANIRAKQDAQPHQAREDLAAFIALIQMQDEEGLRRELHKSLMPMAIPPLRAFPACARPRPITMAAASEWNLIPKPKW